MGFKPIINTAAEIPVREETNPFLRALNLINRPHSAISGFLSEGARGGDPVAAFKEGITGEQSYGGQDVLAALGLNPESKTARYGGLAFDFLNPLDPVNYLGVGVLSKAGKAAKLGARLGGEPLAKGLKAQAQAGQRHLLSLNTPLGEVGIAGAPVLGALEKSVDKLAESAFGRAVQKHFGGRRGAALGSVDPGLRNIASELYDELKGAESRRRGLKSAFDPINQTLVKSLRSDDDRVAFADFLDDFERRRASGQAEDFLIEATRFAGGDPGRQEAVKAIADLYPLRAGILDATVGKTGQGAYASDVPGYLPRLVRALDKKPTAFLEQPVTFAPGTPVDNVFNRGLTQVSIQPIGKDYLTQEGKLQYRFDADKMPFSKRTPYEKREFAARYHMTAKEQDEYLQRIDKGYSERDLIPRVKAMQDQTLEEIHITDLVETFKAKGIAVPWNDAMLHTHKKINQGKFADEPLAIANEYDQVLKNMLDAMMPAADKPILGQFFADALGDPKQGPLKELMAWWKTGAIFGAVPSGYWSRNIATGFVNNMVEGLGPQSIDGVAQASRHYRNGMVLAGNFMRGNLDGAIQLRNGITLDKKWLHQVYNQYRFHGGHIPDVDLLVRGEGLSADLRRKLLKKTGVEAGTAASEAFVRLPLMLKYLEDTFDLAIKNGMDVPKHIKAMTPDELLASSKAATAQPQKITGGLQRMELNADVLNPALHPVVNAAVENAREAVIRAHFDYADLSPTEQRLRAFWIPFYTWYRKNIPRQTLAMITEPGKYSGFARAYYQAFDQEGITLDDLPEWAQKSFALPVPRDEDGRIKWVDFSGYLPFVEPLEAAGTLLTEPRPGGSRPQEALRFLGTRLNPFGVQAAEQALRRNLFTDREFSGEVPKDYWGWGSRYGLPGAPAPRADLLNLLGLVRPAGDIDRLNPFNVFGKERPHRNEPDQSDRWIRALTGYTVRKADDDIASMSENKRDQYIKSLKSKARTEKRNGNKQQEQFFLNKVRELEGK